MKTNKKPHSRVALRHHVKQAVIPHKGNNYAPHLIRTAGIIAVLFIAVTSYVTTNWHSETTVLGTKASVTSRALLDQTNSERRAHNVKELVYSEELSTAAFYKAKDMLAKQYWAHDAPDGTTPWHWFSAVEYNYAYAGENLAKNFTTAAATTTAWMASEKHRDNILNPDYTEVGFAVTDGTLFGSQTKLIVALYAQPTSQLVAGVTIPNENGAPIAGSISPVTRFGIVLKSMHPAVLGSLILILFTTIVALTSHTYRRQLPLKMRRSITSHHGLFKAIGLTAVMVVFITLYSGGQI